MTREGLLNGISKNKPIQSQVTLRGGKDAWKELRSEEGWKVDKHTKMDDIIDQDKQRAYEQFEDDASGFGDYEEFLIQLNKHNPKKYPLDANKALSSAKGTWSKKLFDELDEGGYSGLDMETSWDVDEALDNLYTKKYKENPITYKTIKGIRDSGDGDRIVVYKDQEGRYNAYPEGMEWGDNDLMPEDGVYSINEVITQLEGKFGNTGSIGKTKHSGATQPGLDLSTYEETYITSDMVKKSGGFRHTAHHGDIEDVIVHLRTGVRQDVDGNKVLFIEELQSDLHQAGRQKDIGYKSQISDPELQSANKKYRDTETSLYKARDIARANTKPKESLTDAQKLVDDLIKARDNDVEGLDMYDLYRAQENLTNQKEIYDTRLIATHPEYKKATQNFLDAKYELSGINRKQSEAMPNAPLRDDAWIQAGLEKAIQMAKAKGVGRVAWTNSKQQVDQWSDYYEDLYKELYDNKLPGAAKRLANEHGSKSGKTKMDFSSEDYPEDFDIEVNYIDINKNLAKGLEQGIALRSAAVAPVGAALQTKDSDTNDISSFIKGYESYKGAGYYATKEEESEGLVTAGYGSTRRVKHGEKVTKEQAEKWLKEDIKKAHTTVDRLVKIKLNNNQKNALVSLVYNVGEGNFKKSKALKALNSGDIETFLKEAFDPKIGFVKAKKGGRILKGLVNRRSAEKELFLKGTK